MSDEPGAADAAWAAALARAPWAHDFFQTLRRLEARTPALPRLGRALRPAAEPWRFGQDIALDMAPAALSSFDPGEGGRPPRLGVRLLGLWGPDGPMPLHLTETLRLRLRQGDAAAARFADLFHHRMLLLYYRAWAQAHPVAQADRPDDDGFGRWLGALAGHGDATARCAGPADDAARRFHAGARAGVPRRAEALEKILRAQLQVPVRLQPFVLHRLRIPADEGTRLLRAGSAAPRHALGVAATAGRCVPDRQSRIALQLGPLRWREFQRFLPGRPGEQVLREQLLLHVGPALQAELRLVLAPGQAPPLQLLPRAGARGGQRWAASLGRLGLTSWLGPWSPAARTLRRPPDARRG